MNKIEHTKLILSEGQELVQKSINEVVLKNKNNTHYLLKNPHTKFTYEPEKKELKIQYLVNRKNRNKIDGLLNTWTKKIKERTNTYYTYTVEVLYKHFPIIINLDTSNIQKQKVTVENYYGCKDTFSIVFTKLSKKIEYNDQTKVLKFETFDDVITGNELELFQKLRYKTNLKKLDRHIFTDGFFTKKTIHTK